MMSLTPLNSPSLPEIISVRWYVSHKVCDVMTFKKGNNNGNETKSRVDPNFQFS